MASFPKRQATRAMSRWLKNNILHLIFVLPLILFVFSFTIVPIFQTIASSFQHPITGQWSLESYGYVLGRKVFGVAVGNTLLLTAIALSMQIGIGFLIALALKQAFRGKGLVRSLVLLPMGVPTLVSGVAMLYVFSTSGYLNEILYRLGLIRFPVDWTASNFSSLMMVAIADCWKVVPMVTLLILSGLESIPGELYEASAIDGANAWKRFCYITLPQLKATMTMTILMRMVDLLKIFEMPQVLLGRSTPFLGTLAYEEYKYGNLTYSASVSTTLLCVIIIGVCLYLWIFNTERAGKNAKP